MTPLIGIGGLGGTELLIILAIVILIFGAKKLPELARGSGQALRIFKAETKELKDKDAPAGEALHDDAPPEEHEIQALDDAERARHTERQSEPGA